MSRGVSDEMTSMDYVRENGVVFSAPRLPFAPPPKPWNTLNANLLLTPLLQLRSITWQTLLHNMAFHVTSNRRNHTAHDAEAKLDES